MEASITIRTPIGYLAITARGQLITSVQIVSGREQGRSRITLPRTATAARLAKDLRDSFRGRFVDFIGYRLDLSGATPFQAAVWKAARRIPRGTVLNYGQLARRIGRPRAARAVGNALHANPFLIVVPCHRVVRGDGTLGGFGAGKVNKQRLLLHEGLRLPLNHRHT